MSEWRETVEAIRVLGIGRFLYSGLIYRRHMRFLHKRNKHRREPRPIDGNLYCSWCGHLEAPDGTVIIDGPAMMARIAELSKSGNGLISNPAAEQSA